MKKHHLIYLYLCLALMLSTVSSSAQISLSVGYKIKTLNMPALQSYAIGEYDEKLILVGGRKDGLHLRQPSFAFDSLSRNEEIWVYDPKEEKGVSISLNNLPATVAAQLASTNTQFAQRDKYLYITGGYGYDPTRAEHRTYPALIALHLPSVIAAAQTPWPMLDSSALYVVTDSALAVTGGVMHVFDDHFILAGGHRFDGLYNPVDLSTFTQTYHERIVEFEIDDTSKQIKILHTLEDSLLHRRDLSSTVVEQKTGDRLVLFAGVFRKDHNFPFQNILEYQNQKLRSVTDFRQCLSTYHTATTTLDLSSLDADMAQASLFLGGLAPYYMEDTLLCYDADVPFVSTISMLTRDNQGEYTEWLSHTRLPAYLGTGAHWVSHRTTPSNKKAKFELGYFIGGIKSPEHNVFWSAEDSPSVASPYLCEVYLEPCDSGWTEFSYSRSPYNIDVFPDRDYTHFTFHWDQDHEKILLELYKMDGARMFSQYFDTEYKIHQTLDLEEPMQEKAFMLHFRGKEEYWIKVLNND